VAKEQYAVLVISPWRNPSTGEEGTRFIKVGIAYERDVGGFTCYLYDNVAVSGKLLIAPDLDEQSKSKKQQTPTANQPFPPTGGPSEPF
jgi:hypothetical protein